MGLPDRGMVVAIDGPAASGKSSTASFVAREVGFRHLDSGALYRAVTAARLRVADGLPAAQWTEASLLTAAEQCALLPAEVSFIPTIAGTSAEDEVRRPAVTSRVSAVASVAGVRVWVNDQLRGIALTHDVVVDGRDIGTAVFPDAPVKIYLVADPWERARRRLIQLEAREPTDAELAEETERLVQRDSRDAQQSMPAHDSILIDTTYISQPEQVARIVALVRSAVQRRRPAGG